MDSAANQERAVKRIKLHEGERIAADSLTAVAAIVAASAASAAAATAGDLAAPPRCSEPADVLFKVHDSHYTGLSMRWDTLAGLHRGTLLETLAGSRAFGPQLEGVALAHCLVYVRMQPLPAGQDEPNESDEANRETFPLLKGMKTLRDASMESGCAGACAYVYVTLPSSAPAAAAAAAAAPSVPLAMPIEMMVALREALLTATDLADVPGRKTASRLLSLPNGVAWPQLGSKPLLVRHFYEALFEGPLASLDPGGTASFRKFTIVGNAGIGKSAFGCYLLWQAVRARRTVVYASAKEKLTRVFFSDGTVNFLAFQDNFENVLGLLQLESTVLIVDSAEPPSVNAFTVLITSPLRQRWKEFNKNEDAILLVVPVFSEEEIWDLKAAAFSDLDDTGVQDRFRRWGGIPRYVLSKLQSDDQEELDDALTRVDVSALARLLQAKEIEDEHAISHRLLHLKCRGEAPALDGEAPPPPPTSKDFYRLAKMSFASSYVADAVAKAMEGQRKK